MRVIVTDDHPLILEGIAGLLRTAGHTVVRTCTSGRELLDQLQTGSVDAVTLDIGMPGGSNGIEVAQQISTRYPKTKVVIVSQQTGAVYVRSALQAGVNGFVAKQSSSRELLVALEKIMRGQTYVTPGLLDQQAGSEYTQESASKRKGLTQRQRDVLQLVADGKTAKEVAAALDISVKTVEFHKQALMRGLNLHTTAELTRYAIAEGLITL